jgi:ketosteroid isomerase-like protein
MTVDRRAVVAANQEFYRAFRERDLPAMHRVWARECHIVCVHPGWEPLAGHAAVLDSWAAVLASPSSPPIVADEEHVVLTGQAAIVVCSEHIDDVKLCATNVFVREDGAWKIAAHHASPLSRLRPTPPPSTLN